MTTERRSLQRVRCFLSASTPKGEGIIDELTAAGGRLTAPFEAVQGERIPLTIYAQGGAEIAVEIQVARIWKSPTGYRMGWTFGTDTRSRDQAGRLFNQVSRPNLSEQAGKRTATESKSAFTSFRRPFR